MRCIKIHRIAVYLIVDRWIQIQLSTIKILTITHPSLPAAAVRARSRRPQALTPPPLCRLGGAAAAGGRGSGGHPRWRLGVGSPPPARTTISSGRGP